MGILQLGNICNQCIPVDATDLSVMADAL